MDFRDIKTARAVLMALPSSYLPFDISAREAREIGYRLFPESMLMLKDGGGATMREVACEMLGRGFMYSAIGALPSWLQKVFVMKADSKLPHEELEREVAKIIELVDDADKLAAGWVDLACGYTEEEVIEDWILNAYVPEPVANCTREIAARLTALEEE